MMKSIYIILTVLFAICLNSNAQEKTWVRPNANYRQGECLTIERVEFADTATTLFFHCDLIPQYFITVAPNCFLRSGGKEYPIRSAKGVEFGKRLYMPDSGEADFSLSFSPMTNSDEPFDFVEPDGWLISYIRRQEIIPENLTDTYWRDMKTGEWLIGFADGKIVYNSKIWRSVQTEAGKDAYAFTIERDGESSHTVAVGKINNGVSRITIDGQKAADCNIINTNVLGEYPETDEVSQWNKDNITRMDTAYICGWMKGLDKAKLDTTGTINMFVHEIFVFKQKKYSATLDSLGYFEIKVPMMGASSIFFTYNYFSHYLSLEPGKHYFMLCDFNTGHNLMMGEDVRVQNEELAHGRLNTAPVDPFRRRKKRDKKLTPESYLDYVFEAHNKNLNILERGFKKYPTLSARYREMVRNNVLVDAGVNLWQSGFMVKLDSCERYHQFMKDSCLAQLPRPLTLYPFIHDMISDYVSTINQPEDSLSYLKALKAACACIPDQDYRDIYAARRLIDRTSHSQTPLTSELEEFVRTNISCPVAKERVEEENQMLFEPENGSYENIQKCLKTIDFGTDVKTGKQMLEEILKPLQGKMVLVGFWGTWCYWYCDEMEHFQEIYKDLADYDIAYVYLANRSNDIKWKNVIQKYNVVGDNVYHYNLPEEQENEIECALDIDTFPMYFLFDSNGKLVGKDVNASDVQKLKSLLEKHGAKGRQ